jgi:hypothetical protein
MTNLFSSRALKHRHQSGERSGPITLLSPPLKATLALGVLIAIGGGLWATLAKIPVSVNGIGALVPASTISTSLSQNDGVAIWMFQQTPAAWEQQAWQFQQRPGSFNDQSVAQLARAISVASAAQSSPPSALSTEGEALLRFRGTRFPAGRLLLWVQSSGELNNLSSALDQLDRTLRDSAAQRHNIEAQQVVLRRELTSRRSYLASMRGLEARGFVSRASILEEQATVDGISSQIHSNSNQLIALSRESDKAYQALRAQLASVIQRQLFFAPRLVYLDQVLTENGEAVSRGQELLRFSNESIGDTPLVPVFLGSNEMAQVQPGMMALATPDGYKRAEVGGIRAKVVFKARLPSDLQTVTNRVGVRSLAQQIVAQEPSPTLVFLELKRSDGPPVANSGGYQWSSRSALPFPPTPGERLDVEITTRLVRPIELVLPSLRQLFGLTPPNPPANTANRDSGT